MSPASVVPPSPAGGNRAGELAELLRSCVSDPSRVLTGVPQRAAAAHDASHYLLDPQAVVRAASAQEVGALMAAARATGLPLTLRSGGTSLSGQAGTDGLLVDVRTHWRQAEVLDDGLRIRVQPGLTVRQANARLARHGRRLGPDPASESACTIGGVVANNSSGMTCGTQDNTYRTLESLEFVLPRARSSTRRPTTPTVSCERENPNSTPACSGCVIGFAPRRPLARPSRTSSP